MNKKYAFLPRNQKSAGLAKNLRKNMTKQEKHLWYDYFKLLPVSFYRQFTIENYIVDFYCPKAHLVIEIDGSQHYEEKNRKYDNKRTYVLSRYGITVIRYTNRDIDERFDSVCRDISNRLNQRLGLSL